MNYPLTDANGYLTPIGMRAQQIYNDYIYSGMSPMVAAQVLRFQWQCILSPLKTKRSFAFQLPQAACMMRWASRKEISLALASSHRERFTHLKLCHSVMRPTPFNSGKSFNTCGSL